MLPWALGGIDPLAWCGWLPGCRLRTPQVRPPGPIGRSAPNMVGRRGNGGGPVASVRAAGVVSVWSPRHRVRRQINPMGAAPCEPGARG